MCSATLSFPILSTPAATRFPRRRAVGVKATAAMPTTTTIKTNNRSLYEILRVDNTASQKAIKAAYRSLAKQYHPDVNVSVDGHDHNYDDGENGVEISDGLYFMMIRNAYETLSDPASREIYDLSRAAVAGRMRRRPIGCSGTGRVYQTSRWETDQCW